MWQKTAALIEAFLAGGGAIQTRLRELSTGVVEDMPGALTLSGIVLRAEEVVAALAQLETRRLVVCSETVHPHDSCEYARIWRLAEQ